MMMMWVHGKMHGSDQLQGSLRGVYVDVVAIEQEQRGQGIALQCGRGV
jgi:hypothetical protein